MVILFVIRNHHGECGDECGRSPQVVRIFIAEVCFSDRDCTSDISDLDPDLLAAGTDAGWGTRSYPTAR